MLGETIQIILSALLGAFALGVSLAWLTYAISYAWHNGKYDARKSKRSIRKRHAVIH